MFSAAEQLQLELINRARLDPLAEAARLGIDLNAGLSTETLDGSARQPLAPNVALSAAAEGHSQWMLAADMFSHTGEGGSSAGQRITAAGYGWTIAGENLSWRGTTGTIDLHAAMSDHHDDLFRSAGHRRNLLDDRFREIGIAQERGAFTDAGTTYDTSMLTNKFGSSGTTAFLTGVAYADDDENGFYSIGEGTAGVTVAAAGASAVTAGAGGYALALGAAAGAVAVRFNFGTSEIRASVEIAGGNVKLDLMDGLRLLSSASLTLLDGVGEAQLLGIADLSLTGNDVGNLLIGNAGDNLLLGGAGDDLLRGGPGDDVIQGGRGRNTAIYAGNAADYAIGTEGAAVLVTDLRAVPQNEGADRLFDIVLLRFADGDVVLNPTPDPDREPDPEPRPTHSLSGRLLDRAGHEVADVGVSFTPHAGPRQEVASTADGRFALDIAPGIGGMLQVARVWSAGDPAISPASALEALRLSVGIAPSWGLAQAADFIAADLDGDGRVTGADALAILRSAVGLDGPHAPHWVFVDPADPLEGVDRHNAAFRDALEIAALDAPHSVDLTGILVGHVAEFT